jgi:hypothetical protein
MHDLAVEQPVTVRADVRMRTHVGVLGAGQLDRPEVVEEHERADAAALGDRQRAADGEAG